jgi:hypothetical protein
VLLQPWALSGWISTAYVSVMAASNANVPSGNIAVLAAYVVNPQISKTVIELFLNPLIG